MQPAKEKLHILYQLYERPMYHIAYAILHHTQQTEDAVSEAFCKVIVNLDKIGDPESPQTKQYMIQIIRNTSISQYRKMPEKPTGARRGMTSFYRSRKRHCPVPWNSRRNRRCSRQH